MDFHQKLAENEFPQVGLSRGLSGASGRHSKWSRWPVSCRLAPKSNRHLRPTCPVEGAPTSTSRGHRGVEHELVFVPPGGGGQPGFSTGLHSNPTCASPNAGIYTFPVSCSRYVPREVSPAPRGAQRGRHWGRGGRYLLLAQTRSERPPAPPRRIRRWRPQVVSAGSGEGRTGSAQPTGLAPTAEVGTW